MCIFNSPAECQSYQRHSQWYPRIGHRIRMAIPRSPPRSVIHESCQPIWEAVAPGSAEYSVPWCGGCCCSNLLCYCCCLVIHCRCCRPLVMNQWPSVSIVCLGNPWSMFRYRWAVYATSRPSDCRRSVSWAAVCCPACPRSESDRTG